MLAAVDPTPFFTARSASVARRSRVLVDDVNLELGPGAVVEISGANGCGKTTLLRAVAGLHPLTAADVAWRGRRSWLGALDDQPIDVTVHRYLEAMARVHGWKSTDRATRVDEIIERFGLGTVRDKTVRTLSTGWRRRTAVAQAVLPRAALAIVDEPVAGLDPEAAALVWRAFAARSAEGGAVVFATPEPTPGAPAGGHQLVIRDAHLVAIEPAPPAPAGEPMFDVRLLGSARDRTLPRGNWTATADGSDTIVKTREHDLDRFLVEALAAGWSVREIRPPAP